MLLLCAICLVGCNSEKYKQEADGDVYQIIDQVWQEEYGPKANYRVNDVKGTENDISRDLDPNNFDVISLAQAVSIATVQNRNYQEEKELLYEAALQLTEAQYDFDPQLSSMFSGTYNDASEALALSNSTSFERMLANGAKVSIDLASDWIRILMGDRSTSIGTILTSTLTLPLLKGSGEHIAREGLTQAERDVIYQLRRFSQFRKKFVVDIIKEYYSVLQSYDRARNEQSNYNGLVILEERTSLLAQAGRLPFFEVDQASQQTLSAKNDLIDAQQSYKSNLDSFKITLGLPTEYNLVLDPEELSWLYDMEITGEAGFTLEDAVNIALSYRMDLKIENDRLQDAKRKVVVAEDALRAGLSISASSSIVGVGSRASDISYGGVETYEFSLDLPLDRLVERNAYRNTLLQHEKQKRAYSLAHDQVKLDVRESFRNLKQAAIGFQISEQSLELAEKRVESNDLLLEAGRAQIRDLLEAQGALIRAQNGKTSALIQYTNTKLDLLRNMEILQVRPDGYWEQKL